MKQVNIVKNGENSEEVVAKYGNGEEYESASVYLWRNEIIVIYK